MSSRSMPCFLASLRMDLAFSMSEGNTGAVMPKQSKMASVSSIRLSASERGMNWVRSVLPSLWMKFSLPSENSPPPPIPERIWQGSHFMHFLALPSGQPRFLTMLPRSTMHTDKSEWSASHQAANSPAGPPPTMMTSNVFDIKILQKGWHKRGRQEKARRRGIVG